MQLTPLRKLGEYKKPDENARAAKMNTSQTAKTAHKSRLQKSHQTCSDCLYVCVCVWEPRCLWPVYKLALISHATKCNAMQRLKAELIYMHTYAYLHVCEGLLTRSFAYAKVCKSGVWATILLLLLYCTSI